MCCISIGFLFTGSAELLLLIATNPSMHAWRETSPMGMCVT